MQPDYCYNATVLRVIDGDTVVIRVDVGFRMWAEMPMRLAYINAPEMNTLEGKDCKVVLENIVANHPGRVVVKTYKPIDKYGRYLGTLYINDVDVNQYLLESGWAKKYDE